MISNICSKIPRISSQQQKGELNNPFDYEDALWGQFQKVGFWTISLEATKQRWKTTEFCRFAVVALLALTYGILPLILHQTPWAFIALILGYFVLTGASIVSWDAVLAATYRLASKTVWPYVNRHSDERRFLRFFLWHQACIAAGINPRTDMLKRIIPIVKAQHDVWEVKWGLADLVKKAGASAAIWFFALLPFSLFVSDQETGHRLEVVANAAHSLSPDTLLASVWGILIVGGLFFWLLAVNPTRVTRQRKEFALFLTWWCEGLAERQDR